jgi:hypothetical protein
MKVVLPAYLTRGDYLAVKNMSDDGREMAPNLAKFRPSMQVLAEQLVASNPNLVIVWVNIVPRLLRLYALANDRRINASTRLLFCQALLNEPTVDLKELPKC